MKKTITLTDYQWSIVKGSIAMHLMSLKDVETRNEAEEKDMDAYIEAHKTIYNAIEKA